MSTTILTDTRHQRADMQLVRRAVREGWKIPPQVLEVLPRQVVKIFLDPDTPTRDKLKAADLVMKMHAQNVEFDQTAEPPAEMKPLSDLKVTEDNIELVKEIAAQRLAQIRDDDGPG